MHFVRACARIGSRRLFLGLLTALLLSASRSSGQQKSRDALVSGFQNPPNSARPRLWWHWLNGNISRAGIQLDLDWMSRIGIGGVQVFDAAIDTPQVVDKRLAYMSPEWKDALRLAVSIAAKRGLEMTIASSAGWSETGGPWVTPQHAMKKMVWSETPVHGGERSSPLPQPPDIGGTFQNDPRGQGKSSYVRGGFPPPPPPRLYVDSAVVAYRLPSAEAARKPELPQITTSHSEAADAAGLSDGDVVRTAVTLMASEGIAPWIQFEYASPQRMQAITLATTGDQLSIFKDQKTVGPLLEASADGTSFFPVAEVIPTSVVQRTIAFAPVSARFFRLVFTQPASSGRARGIRISELILHQEPRVNHFEEKAGFATAPDYYAVANRDVLASEALRLSDCIDLTSKLRPDGSLDWVAPEGEWKVLRIGYSPTAHENSPASPESTGLEVDKLNPGYVRDYLETYLATYRVAVGSAMMGRHGIGSVLTDSTEAGAQNWTDDILTQFRRLRGYDPIPWLPALTGRIIESAEATDRFLWDFRRTIAVLISESHYHQISDVLHRNHLGYYGEALEFDRPALGDDLEMRKSTDVPMGAMWTYPAGGSARPEYLADLQGAASVAHVYGKTFVGAESLTAVDPKWGFAPADLKPIVDLEFALGVNRVMIHESAHQPLLDKRPGLSLGIFGQWFNRNETWAEEAAPWISYISRSSFLLQQGKNVADIAYFYGEEAPLTSQFRNGPPPEIPPGYHFDFVNSDILLHELAVHKGAIVSRGGASYRVLYLGGTSQRMTLPVLLRLRDLVRAGAIVVGERPVASPSLADDEQEFKRVADELWAEPRTSGIGDRVVSGGLAESLKVLGIAPDLEYSAARSDSHLMFLHRKTSQADIYFISNRDNTAARMDVNVRSTGRSAELWHADSGAIERPSYRIVGDRTTVPLSLNPKDAVFLVLRRRTRRTEYTSPRREISQSQILDGPWRVSFIKDRGGPGSTTFDSLHSWSDSTTEGIRYYSGTATYAKTFYLESRWFRAGSRILLDLGEVDSIARTSLNGHATGITWHAPHQLDVTRYLHPGDNRIDVAVTNLWVNRLIGDRQPGNTKKYTFTSKPFYNADSPLLPSGLLGPVQILLSTPRGIRHARGAGLVVDETVSLPAAGTIKGEGHERPNK